MPEDQEPTLGELRATLASGMTYAIIKATDATAGRCPILLTPTIPTQAAY